MTIDQFREALHELVGETEAAGLELPALIKALREQADAMDPQEQRTTSLGLVNYGESYLCAAEILLPYTDQSKEDRLAFDDPVIFLALHAVELFLKGFLRAHGCTVDRLRKRFGHDLSKLLRASLRLAWPTTCPCHSENEIGS